MSVNGFGIPKASHHPQAAFKFIEWQLSRKRGLRRIRAGHLPSVMVPDRTVLLANLQALGQVAPHYADVVRWTFNHGFMLPYSSWYIGDDNYWSIPYMKQALDGEMEPANALDATAVMYNNLLTAGVGWRAK